MRVTIVIQSIILFFLSGRIFTGLAAGLGVIVFWPFLAAMSAFAILTQKNTPTLSWMAVMLLINLILVRIVFAVI